MDDTAIIRTYGNPDLPEGTPDRPLVTFAVFAYNQEQYIREAVEGAFAQTYSPLEIILSDDCSSDRTFEIMEEMAKAYEGPHRVIVRLGLTNLGTIDHLISVARISSGKYLIVAAGDDVSYSSRTEVVVNTMTSSEAIAAYSGFDVISNDGRILEKDFVPKPLAEIQKIFGECRAPRRIDGRVLNIPGMSAAYSTDIVSALPLTYAGCLNEDALLTFVVNLEGSVIAPIPETLLAYRESISGVSSRNRIETITNSYTNECKSVRFAKTTVRFYQYLERLIETRGYEDSEKFLLGLRERRVMASVMSAYYERNAIGRLGMMAWAFRLKPREIRNRCLRYMIPRFLGIRTFSALKYVRNQVRGLRKKAE